MARAVLFNRPGSPVHNLVLAHREPTMRDRLSLVPYDQ
jgi:hypothetical protein